MDMAKLSEIMEARYSDTERKKPTNEEFKIQRKNLSEIKNKDISR